jgi:2-keto-3-deoxy-L-rhamnonate aldolase RhmA
LIEIVGMAGGLDGVWIDQEHVAITHSQLEILLLACRAADLDAFVRVAPVDYGTIMWAMSISSSGA